MPPHTPTYVRDCVLYLRKSKGRAGITRQRKEARAYADRIRWRIIAEFVEADTTAFARIDQDDAPRPEYERMMAFVRRDDRTPPVGILAWHTDRLSRNTGEVRPFTKDCLGPQGVHLVETTRCGSYDLSLPAHRKRFRDDVSDAEGEVDHMIERIDSAKAEAAAEGRWLGGPRPFGFHRDGTRHKKDEAQAIVDGTDAALAGASRRAIGREWMARGLPTTAGNPWTGQAVGRVLARPRNAGLMEWRGQIIGKAAWKPIVPEAKWRALVRLLRDPAWRTTSGPERRWLGSGVYLCGVCGQARMRVQRASSAYRCRGDVKRGGAQHVTRLRAPLDEYVGEHVVARLSRPDARELLVAEDHPERDALEARLLELRAELAEADAARPRTVREARLVAEVAERAEEEIRGIEQRLLRPDLAVVLRHLIEARDVGAAWEATPVDRQQAALRLLFVVTLLPAPRRGRPAGWRVGGPYFQADAVDIRTVTPS
jgi:site-specific DNA recombinase